MLPADSLHHVLFSSMLKHCVLNISPGFSAWSPGPGSSAFSVFIRRMPADSAIRVGWISEEGDLLVGQSQEGWGYHASRSYGFLALVFHNSPFKDH